jgi:hypothetical protein
MSLVRKLEDLQNDIPVKNRVQTLNRQNISYAKDDKLVNALLVFINEFMLTYIPTH